MNFPQGITIIEIDNYTADVIINKRTQKNHHAPWTLFYLVQDLCAQYQFSVKFQLGDTNLGDYFTKYQLLSHNNKMQPVYLENKIHNRQIIIV